MKYIVSGLLFSPSKNRVLFANEYSLGGNVLYPVRGLLEPGEFFDTAMRRIWSSRTGDVVSRSWARFAQVCGPSTEVFYVAISKGPLIQHPPQVSSWAIEELMSGRVNNILWPDGKWLIQLALSALSTKGFRHYRVTPSSDPPKE
jgi:hypothetical protein